MTNIAGLSFGRRILAVSLVVVLAFAGLGGCASTPNSPKESANIGVVDGFIAAWSDPDRAVTFLSNDASVRMVEDQPPVVGQQAVLAAFKSFMTPGVTLTVETLETTAYGPVVVNRRVDTLKEPGKPDQVFPVAGVFIVKHGKIVEWTDYLLER